MYILWTTIQLESHLLNIPGAVSCCHCLEFSLRKPSQHLDIALFIMHLFFEGKFAPLNEEELLTLLPFSLPPLEGGSQVPPHLWWVMSVP